MAGLQKRENAPLTKERASELLELTLPKSPLGLRENGKKLREEDSDSAIIELMGRAMELTQGKIIRTLQDGSTETVKIKKGALGQQIGRLLQYRNIPLLDDEENEEKYMVGPSNEYVAELFIADLEKIPDQESPIHDGIGTMPVREFIRHLREKTELGLEYIRLYRAVIMAQDELDRKRKPKRRILTMLQETAIRIAKEITGRIPQE